MQLSSRHLISAYDYPRDDLRYVIQTADCRIQVCGELGIVPLYESDGGPGRKMASPHSVLLFEHWQNLSTDAMLPSKRMGLRLADNPV
jgi:hypothetical protein